MRDELDYQTRLRGSLEEEYDLYTRLADDGSGGDITREGEPLLTFDEWLSGGAL